MMRAVAAICLFWALFQPRRAQAEAPAEVCASAAEQVQSLRSQGKLIATIAELRTCLRTFCPEAIRRDCAEWQVDIEASTPTIILAARSPAGRDLAAVTVTVDEAFYLEKLDGVARPLDPGLHHIRFETSGSPPVESEVVLKEGDKRRLIQVTFALADVGHSDRRRLPTPARQPDGHRTSVISWVALGVGLGALAGSAALGLTGLSDLRSMEEGCGKTRSCASSDVASLKTQLEIADGLLGLGIVSISLAGWLHLKPRVDVAITALHSTALDASMSVDGSF